MADDVPAEDPARRVIPSGAWQVAVGLVLDAFGLFAALAATPFNGAGEVATFCLTVGSSFLFWGLMLRYFSALETKLIVLLERSGPAIHRTGLSETVATPEVDQ